MLRRLPQRRGEARPIDNPELLDRNREPILVLYARNLVYINRGSIGWRGNRVRCVHVSRMSIITATIHSF